MNETPMLIQWKSWWNFRIPRPDLMVLVLCAAWAFMFRLPVSTPLEGLYYKLEWLYMAGITLLYVAYTGYRILFLNESMRSFEVILMGLMAVPVVAAFVTQLRFGQPAPYGIATQREYFNLLTVALVFNLLHRNIITLPMVRNSLVWMAWFTVFFLLFVYFFVDFQTYSSLGGRVSYNPLRGERLGWERFLTAFGGIYYAILFFRNPSWRTSIPLGLIAGYIILITLSRGYTVCYLAVVGAFLLEQSARIRGRGVKIFMVGMFVSIFVVFAPIFLSEDIQHYIAVGFGSIFKMFATGDYTAESSINARIREYELIVPYISNHPWLGYGEVSNKWTYTLQDLVGRVWVNDLGIIGGVFTYGIVGVLFILLPYWLYWRVPVSVTAHRHDPFMLACKYYILYILLNTVTGNTGIHNPAPGMLMLALLLYYRSLLRRNGGVAHRGTG